MKNTYSDGYQAASKRVFKLKAEIERLELKLADETKDPHNVTIEYLLDSADMLTKAAELLINIRLKPTTEATPATGAATEARE